MNTRKWFAIGATLFVLVLLGSSVGARSPGPVANPFTPMLTWQAGTRTHTVILNEVMPKAEAGQPEWVELYNDMPVLYLPLVMNSHSTQAARYAPAAVNAGAGVSITGWQVTDEDGHVYTIPTALPVVPPKAYVLVYFDGQGAAADDYDFSDGKAVLHTPAGLTNVFDDAADQVALYTSGTRSADTIVDFLAYGGPPGDEGANAISAGIWDAAWYKDFSVGFGDIDPAGLLAPNESLGLYPGSMGGRPDAWAVYRLAQLTPGLANPVPAMYFYTPDDGAIVDSEHLSMGWATVPGATGYRIQLSTSSGFASTITDTVVTAPFFKPAPPLATGAYYWRVQPLGPGGMEGPWSSPIQIGSVALVTINSPSAEKVLAINRVRQNKDSRMLCFDGDPEGDPTTNNPENAWDAPAPCTQPPCTDYTKYTHGNMNCVRASIRMMASYYGGQLTMDRISYHVFEENPSSAHRDGLPTGDLGHNAGMSYPGEEDEAIQWAFDDASIVHVGGKPTFAQFKTWIDADRPVMFRNPGHMMVINGYRDDATGQWVHVLDPDQPPDLERWQQYSTQNIDGAWPGPVSAPSVRSDEASVSADSDGDGIVDFDELYRFHTNPARADSDSDLVNDKPDLREYVYNAANAYNLRNADMDGDGKRKELDADNDNDSYPDGCEDANSNGKLDAGETDNFSAASLGSCPVRSLNILNPLQANAVNAGDPSAPDKFMVRLSVGVPTSYLPSLNATDFGVKVGPNNAPSPLSGLAVGDEYWLVVQAPGQSIANYYNLTVTLSALSDAETRAVYYLPRARVDEMLVIDSSGSMSETGKIVAAKNAARLYVDHTALDDKIGVAVFTTTAQTAYTLRTVTGATEWDGAKNAINALTDAPSPYWLTALGQGVQQGQNQLTASGAGDHDWAIVLMSDGLQNVAPYWDDATVKGVVVPTKTVVHTIALGPDADQALMSRIASETGGDYYYVPLTGLVAQSAARPEAVEAVYPSTLANRLADVYKATAETGARQQRLWEAVGTATVKQPVELAIPVPDGLPEGIFTANWAHSYAYVAVSLYDADGKLVDCKAAGVQCRTDPTHVQWRIATPKPGTWRMVILAQETSTEYLAMLSGYSPIQMWLGFGLSRLDRTVRTPIPILVTLVDEKPIRGAVVTATIVGPNADLNQTLPLYDDGKHNDGRDGDGVYGNLYTRTYLPGSYVVKAQAEGKSNSGDYFLRYRTGSFYVLPQAVYLYSTELSTAIDYKSLLDGNDLPTTLMPLDAVTYTTSFLPYNLIIIGPETGDGSQWGTPTAVNVIAQSGKPVLGLGEGGYAFFGKLGLDIGYGNGWHGVLTQTYALDTAHQIWSAPYDIPIPKDHIVTLYKATGEVGINLAKPPGNVVLMGREPDDQTHYNLVQQATFYTLWGFQAGPRAMLDTGKKVFVNVAHFQTGW